MNNDNEKYVICQECHKRLKRITNTHLKSCSGISVKEYLNKHPNASIENQELIEKRRINAHNQWNDPNERKKKVEGINQASEKFRKSLKELFNTEDYKQWFSEKTKNNWKDPEIRKKREDNLRASCRTEKSRKNRSKGQLKRLENPVEYQKACKKLEKVKEDPELERKRYNNLIETLTSEDYKDKMKVLMNQPEVKEKISKTLKDLWSDPTTVFNSNEYRNKKSKSQKMVWKDEVHREFLIRRMNEESDKLKNSLKQFWTDPNEREKQSERISDLYLYGNFNPLKSCKSGWFYSHKNGDFFYFRSSYEYRFFEILENSLLVKEYSSEPLKIKYKDENKITRNYLPDLKILWWNNEITFAEIKPKKLLNIGRNPYKISALENFCKQNNFHFLLVTEDILDWVENQREDDPDFAK